MDESGGRLRISLQDLRPLEAAVDRLEDVGEPEPLPPPPPVGRRVSVTFAAPQPVAPEDPHVAEEAVTQFGRPPGSASYSEETVVRPGASERSVIADRYVIEEPIGEGGMGRVFRVRHRRLGKSFALKLMQTAFSENSHARELFYREARLASSLAHPNIVSVIDFGEDPERGAFMVMELLEGESLSSMLHRDGRFSIKPACDIILQIAEALDYIHKRRIVHCDIKPDNILLVSAAPGGRRRHTVKLLDFGLARVGSPSPTTSATIDGTPEYMAPERILGGSPQPSMDIYGLGVLAYEIFTGRPPFRGALAELLHHHVHTPPPAFSDEVRQSLDERAEALVMKALSKNHEHRQRDMAAFIYELRTLMDMLGFGRRRRGAAGAQVVQRAAADRRVRTAATAYDLAPLPMAGLNVDGQIVVANRAFSQFVAGDAATSLEQASIHATRFIDVHPDLSADLRRVHVSSEPLQRVLHLATGDSRPVRLMLWLVPTTGDAGEIQLAVHALDG